MDMKTTVFSYGAPELSLMVAAMAQMAQFYKLPFFGTAGATDAKFPDAQAAAEVAFSCLSSALVGANLVHDAGSWLDHGSLASPAFMVLVNEILYMVNQYMRGISVDEESLALDDKQDRARWSLPFYEDHTHGHFRMSGIPISFDRSIKDVWLEQGEDFCERLRRKLSA
jgi:trimethylamine--corrinoid protein Co-methyltransferase